MYGFRDYFGVCSPFGICAEARKLTLFHCGYAFACYVYLAARRCVETADHVQEGRLSAAAFPDDCGKLAFGNRQADVVQSFGGFILLGYSANIDEIFH